MNRPRRSGEHDPAFRRILSGEMPEVSRITYQFGTKPGNIKTMPILRVEILASEEEGERMKPVTVKELKKKGRIHSIYIEYDEEEFTELKGGDILDEQRDIAGLQIRTTACPDEIIEVTPVQVITDDHIAVCRLKVRRCHNK